MILLYIFVLIAVFLLIHNFLFKNSFDTFQIHEHSGKASHTHINYMSSNILKRIKERESLLKDTDGNSKKPSKSEKKEISEKVVSDVISELSKIHGLDSDQQTEVVNALETHADVKNGISLLVKNMDSPTNLANSIDLLSKNIQILVQKQSISLKKPRVLPTKPTKTVVTETILDVPIETVADDVNCCGMDIFDNNLNLEDINKCIVQHLDDSTNPVKYSKWKEDNDSLNCKTPHNILSKTSNCGGKDGIISKYYKNWKFLYDKTNEPECKSRIDMDNMKLAEGECSPKQMKEIYLGNQPCEERNPSLKEITGIDTYIYCNNKKISIKTCSKVPIKAGCNNEY